MDRWGGSEWKVIQGRGRATRCNMTTSRQMRGKRQWHVVMWRLCIKRTRGGSSATQGWCNNQLANKRQTGEEASVDKRQRSNKRTRGCSGVTRGIVATSQQTRCKRGEVPADKRQRVLKAGGASRLQEVGVPWQENKRRRWHVIRMRGKYSGWGRATTQQPVGANYPSSAFLVLSFALSFTFGFVKVSAKGEKSKSIMYPNMTNFMIFWGISYRFNTYA